MGVDVINKGGNLDGESRAALLNLGDEGKSGGGGLAGDWGSIALLSLLYTLQGIPMGLSGSVPLLLAKKGETAGTYKPPHLYHLLYVQKAHVSSCFPLFPRSQWATQTKLFFPSARGPFR